MQHQRAEDQVKARIPERQQLGVGGDARARRAGEKLHRRLGSDDTLDAPPRGQRMGETAVAGPQIERHGKFPVHDIEPVNQPIGNFGMEKIDRAPHEP